MKYSKYIRKKEMFHSTLYYYADANKCCDQKESPLNTDIIALM